jgi:DNA-binding SARP family transcriptional activator
MAVGVEPHPETVRAGIFTRDAPLRLSLLGGFELRCDDHFVTLAMSGQRLLAFLAMRDRLTPRTYVAGTLWPDSTEGRASANLRSLLWRLHRLGWMLVESTSTCLRLAPDVVTDVQELVTAADRVQDRSTVHATADLALVSRSGELLPGWYEDWLMIERERLHQLRLHALEALCEHLIAVGRYGPAVDAGLAAVAAEPLRESAHRVLIRADLAEGNRADALRHVRIYRRLLHDELGLEPSPQMDDLVGDLEGGLDRRPEGAKTGSLTPA